MMDRRKMAGGGNAAWRGFQSGDAAEVRRHSNGAAAIAADAAGGAERGDGRRLAAARTVRCALQVPGIVGAAGDVVIALVVRKELGTIGLAQTTGAGRAQPGHGGGVALRSMTEPESAAGDGG